jgi:hypothetical protein
MGNTLCFYWDRYVPEEHGSVSLNTIEHFLTDLNEVLQVQSKKVLMSLIREVVLTNRAVE